MCNSISSNLPTPNLSEKEPKKPISLKISKLAQERIMDFSKASEESKLETASQKINQLGRELKPNSWKNIHEIEEYAKELLKYYKTLLECDLTKQKALIILSCLYHKAQKIQFPLLGRVPMVYAFNQFLKNLKLNKSSDLQCLFDQYLLITSMLRTVEVLCPSQNLSDGLNSILQKVNEIKDNLPKERPFILLPGGWSCPESLGNSHQMFILLRKENEWGWRVFLINTIPTQDHNFQMQKSCQQAAVVSEEMDWQEVMDYLAVVIQHQIDRHWCHFKEFDQVVHFSLSRMYSSLKFSPLEDERVTIPIFPTPTCNPQSLFALLTVWYFLTKKEGSAEEEFLHFKQCIFDRYKEALPVDLKEQIKSELDAEKMG